jgi:hypothetical protein
MDDAASSFRWGRPAHRNIGKGGGTMQVVIEVVDIVEIVPT